MIGGASMILYTSAASEPVRWFAEIAPNRETRRAARVAMRSISRTAAAIAKDAEKLAQGIAILERQEDDLQRTLATWPGIDGLHYDTEAQKLVAECCVKLRETEALLATFRALHATLAATTQAVVQRAHELDSEVR